MTIVGKILVFFNLVFSLVVGGFAVMDYTARTHWADGFEKLKNQYEAARTNVSTYQAENAALVKEKQAFNEKLFNLAGKSAGLEKADDVDKTAQAVAKVLKAAQEQSEAQKTELVGLRSQLAAEKKKVSSAETNATAAVEDVSRRQKDVDAMRLTLKGETDKNILLVRDNNDLRDRAVAAEIQSKSFKDMNARLESQLQEMARDVARLRTSAGGAARGVARGTNPPPESVEGLVERAEGNDLLLSIGSDAGLAKGQTLEVFRLGGAPKYLGRIRIMEVSARQAVGQAVTRMSFPVRRGDIVSSHIMPK